MQSTAATYDVYKIGSTSTMSIEVFLLVILFSVN